jgi:hypothetical protein
MKTTKKKTPAKTQQTTPKLLISISGGCLTSILSDQPVQARLIDWDNIKAGDVPNDEAGGNLTVDTVSPDQLEKEWQSALQEAKQRFCGGPSA